MLDNMTFDHDTGSLTLNTEFFGELMVRFNNTGSAITSERGIPFHNDGISYINSEIKKIQEARAELFIHPNMDQVVTINGVDYTSLHFEVRKMHDGSGLNTFIRGRRVGGNWNADITDGARKRMYSEIEKVFFEQFDELAELARSAEVSRFQARTMEYLKEAEANTQRALQHLVRLHIEGEK